MVSIFHGYAISQYEMEKFLKIYNKKNNCDMDICEFMEDIYFEVEGCHYHHDDPAYGCYHDNPHFVITISEKEYYNLGKIFSINGSIPSEPLLNDKGEELFIYYNSKGVKKYEYVLNDNERGYGFVTPEILDLKDLGVAPKYFDPVKHKEIKKTLKEFCVDLGKFNYSSYLFTYYF